MEEREKEQLLQHNPIVIEALMQTWTDGSLKELSDSEQGWPGRIAERVLRHREMARKPAKHRLNDPIDRVVDDYVNRRKGKLLEAKLQLRKRFDGLDHDIQEKVMMAFMEQGSQREREFIYSKLYGDGFWVDDYIPLVQRWWEQFHDGKMGKVVVKYCPREYIMEHLEELDHRCNYATLCLRTGMTPDPERLPAWTYLYVLKTSGGQLRFREGEKVILGWVRQHLYERQGSDAELLHSIFDVPYVSRMLAYLGEMGMAEDILAIEEFDKRMQSCNRHEWANAVIKSIEERFGLGDYVFKSVK